MSNRQQQTLIFLGYGVHTVTDVATALALDPHQAQRVLDALYRRSWATVTTQGKWAATERGRIKVGLKPSVVSTVARAPRVHKESFTRNIVSASERENFGVTVTVREQATGRLHTLIQTGPATAALRRCCAEIDEMEGDWRVCSISTPNSIYRDLQGTRAVEGQGWMVEPKMLAGIGRADLLEPRRAVTPYVRGAA